MSRCHRWKSKCRKQEKEIDRLKESVEQINGKNEEILKESIAGKTQANNGEPRFNFDELIFKDLFDLCCIVRRSGVLISVLHICHYDIIIIRNTINIYQEENLNNFLIQINS